VALLIRRACASTEQASVRLALAVREAFLNILEHPRGVKLHPRRVLIMRKPSLIFKWLSGKRPVFMPFLDSEKM
ncbi:MAG: hypothetical protein C4293_12875, partial [Nitrospiraceae bacterium]